MEWGIKHLHSHKGKISVKLPKEEACKIYLDIFQRGLDDYTGGYKIYI